MLNNQHRHEEADGIMMMTTLLQSAIANNMVRRFEIKVKT